MKSLLSPREYSWRLLAFVNKRGSELEQRWTFGENCAQQIKPGLCKILLACSTCSASCRASLARYLSLLILMSKDSGMSGTRTSMHLCQKNGSIKGYHVLKCDEQCLSLTCTLQIQSVRSRWQRLACRRGSASEPWCIGPRRREIPCTWINKSDNIS